MRARRPPGSRAATGSSHEARFSLGPGGGTGGRARLRPIASPVRCLRPPIAGPSAATQQRQTDTRVDTALRRVLGVLMQQYGDLTGKIPDSLNDADIAMRSALQALDAGDDVTAAAAIQKAIEALQKSGQSMSQQLSQQFGSQQDDGQGDDGDQAGDQTATRPAINPAIRTATARAATGDRASDGAAAGRPTAAPTPTATRWAGPCATTAPARARTRTTCRCRKRWNRPAPRPSSRNCAAAKPRKPGPNRN